MTAIPDNLDAIGAEWLSDQFRQAGHGEVQAASVNAEPLGGISGITGQIGRLRVEWGSGTDLPSTFIAKAPNTDELSRTYNATMRFYARESGFYADLADRVDIPKPRAYLNLYDAATDTNLLVLEDLDPATPGDCIEGCGFDRALELMTTLARIHGTFWMDESLAQSEWLWVWNQPEFVAGTTMLVPDGWQRFGEQEPDFFPSELAEVVERRYVNDVQGWVIEMDKRPYTFCHGDYELDNFLFRDDGAWVVDWQMCLRSCPGTDVAWFIASSGHRFIDRERELLDAYRAALAASGGPAWSHDELMEDLVWGLMFWVAGQPLLVSSDTSVYGPHAERMDRRFRTFLEGTRDAAVRWDLAAVLG